ncbi:flagellar biosynthetic protein FliR [Anaerocolumna xylanovorans]|nr:flagellar biosynthetic protein FliR [Anaerocolumna xylanovorans]
MLILVRISAFVFVAPFFSIPNVPGRVKAGFSLMFALVLFQITTVDIQYSTVIEYATLILKEALTGLIIGFFTNVSYYILNFAGQLMDMEIGFSMVNELDPVANIQTTITSNLYSYAVMLMLMVTDMHLYIIKAFADTFKVIPVGEAHIDANIYLLMADFIKNYFIIGFRIVLPVFAAMLIINTILAILAKVAPQMNMFVIGFQLKIMTGLLMLFILVKFLPTVSGFIFNEMIGMMKAAVQVLK